MFNKDLIPHEEAQILQLLNNIYAHSGASSEDKATVDKKLGKIDQTIKHKLTHTVTVSQYLDQLWKQPDLKESDKTLVIKKLEAIQLAKKNQIKDGEQKIAKVAGDLDVLNEKFKMSPYEEFNYQERVKEIKKKKKLDMESALFTNRPTDLEILHALNRPFKLVSYQPSPEVLHYTAGLWSFEDTQAEILKKQKAEGFVKKIQDQKKIFYNKIKEIEKRQENDELEELERYRRKQQEEEEQRAQEKKKRLEEHIKLLKTRSEARLRENAQWEEEYKVYLTKKPLYKEYESKYQQGYVIPELEERKKKLQQIRDFHKPIGREELIEHEQKVMKLLADRNVERKEQSDKENWTYKKPDFESRHHKTIAEELQKLRKQKEEEQLEKLRRKEKVIELLQEVKEKHVPRVDPQKEMEVLSNIEKYKKKDVRSKTAHEEERQAVDPKKLGVEYLKSVKEQVQKKMKDKPKIVIKQLDKAESEAGSERTDKKRTAQSIKSDGAALKKRNYLSEVRRENKNNDFNQIEGIVKNKKLDAKDKKELLQSEIEKLEEKAKRKELVKKYKIKRSPEDAADDDEEVDQIYINAIKAKLQMLGH